MSPPPIAEEVHLALNGNDHGLPITGYWLSNSLFFFKW